MCPESAVTYVPGTTQKSLLSSRREATKPPLAGLHALTARNNRDTLP